MSRKLGAPQFLTALKANAARDRELQNTANDLREQTKALSMAKADLRSIANNLEDRDQRSKWDWVTLAAGMLISAGLAGAAAVYFTKQQLDTANFQDAITFIQNDDDAYWCDRADGQTISGQSGAKFCAIHMPNYVGAGEPEVVGN